MAPHPSRRSFLQRAGWTAAGITIAASTSGCSLIPALPTRTAPTDSDAFTWLQLKPDGRFLFCSPRQEMGQGVSSTLRLVLADEIGTSPTLIDVIAPDTSIIAPAKSTVGSESIKDFLIPVREIGKTMRAALHVRAAEKLGTEPLNLSFDGKEFAVGGAQISLTELANGAQVLLDPADAPGSALPIRPDKPRVENKSVPTDRIADIVTGAPLFAGDIRVPGMVHGAFVRAPQLGATLKEIDFYSASHGDGLLATYFDDGRAGIVARTPSALAEALEKVEPTWSIAEPVVQENISASLLLTTNTSELEHSILQTDTAPIGPFDIDLNIAIPFAAHAAIEPRAAVARWNDSSDPQLEIWTGTQDAFFVRTFLAKHFGLREEEVVVYSQRIGGGFGGKAIINIELEAAILAKAAQRPVKVHWTRPDEFQEGYHRPPSRHRLRANVDEKGVLTDWNHGFKSGHVIFTSAGMPPWMQSLTSFVSDPGTARGAHLPYRATRAKVAFSDVRMPVKTGPWRGLGAAPNNFAIETAIDQLASKAAIDPLAFRLMNLPTEHERLSVCLTKVAERANWHGPRVTDRSARGIACGIYKEVSYVAIIADIDVDPETGLFQVSHLTCAHDCGEVINPDQVRAQIEGNLMWGIGMVKSEKLSVENGRLSADYLGEYEIPTMADAPAITIDLIEHDNTPPVGAGETAIVASGAAIANAIAAFTGKPVTNLPIQTVHS
jgi:isoquinoline 1-oxidoreductase subunit beta